MLVAELLPETRRVARHVLRESLHLRRGASVLIETLPYSSSLAETIAFEAKELGLRATTVLLPSWAFSDPEHHGKATLKSEVGPIDAAGAGVSDGYIFLAPSLDDLVRRDRLPSRLRRAHHRQRQAWHRALRENNVPSVHLLLASVTPGAARRLGVRFSLWRKEAIAASLVPASQIKRRARAVASRLERGRRLTIRHPNGTRLELGLFGAPPILDDGAVDSRDLAHGRVGATVPGGFLAVPLDATVAEGRMLSNRPYRYRIGWVAGSRWTFHKGALVSHSVRKGRSFFEGSYARGGPERTKPALLTIGLNPAIRNYPFAEDLEEGVVTIHIGHNDDFGGKTRGVFRQVALLRGASMEIDGTPVLRRGRIVSRPPSR